AAAGGRRRGGRFRARSAVATRCGGSTATPRRAAASTSFHATTRASDAARRPSGPARDPAAAEGAVPHLVGRGERPPDHAGGADGRGRRGRLGRVRGGRAPQL